jgi:hypothetical protein
VQVMIDSARRDNREAISSALRGAHVQIVVEHSTEFPGAFLRCLRFKRNKAEVVRLTQVVWAHHSRHSRFIRLRIVANLGFVRRRSQLGSALMNGAKSTSRAS